MTLFPQRLVALAALSFGLLLAPLAYSAQQAVASAHPLATEAGMAILEQGGNAFDAAVTVSAVLAVVEPYNSGFGGGGFWLLHQAKENRYVFLDGRETAPGEAFADMYLDDDGQVNREWATLGAPAAAIPGQPAALAHLTEHYGTLPLSTLLAPAIALAENGFPVDAYYRRLATARRDALTRFPVTRATFLDGGNIPAENHLIVQQELAATLKVFAEQGRAGFYEGPVAEKLVEGVQGQGGLWQLEDLKNYQLKEREPLIGDYRGARIITSPLPSSGGIVLLQTLNQLEAINFDPAHAKAPHLLIETMKRAYQDRALYLGDSDFVAVPVAALLDKQYAANKAKTISPEQASESRKLPQAALHPEPAPAEGQNTTHYSIVDKHGNKVAATLSINLPFGSAFTVPGTGILLNNEMDDFVASPDAPNAYGLTGSTANAIAPHKRPLSSMTPTFVEMGERTAILGTPGGSRIISMVLLGALSALDGHPPQTWVSRPRFHHQYLPDVVEVEPAFLASDDAKTLMLKGHTLKSTGRNYGNMQAILWHKNGSAEAASDPRGIGKSLVK